MQYEHILLIDDDVDDHEIFVHALQKVSAVAKCVAFSDAEDALAELKAGAVKADVIFLDINMPLMDGHQFLAIIKSITSLREIPVIIYSTTSHPATRQKTMELGARDFVTKPATIDELSNLLAAMVLK